MARHQITYTITSEGRDQGKAFLLTEMAALVAEKWAQRAFLALARAGADVPEDIEAAGFAGIASLTLKAFGGVRFEDAEPLLDEMLTCVQVIPEPSRPAVTRPIMTDDDVEEVFTLVELRREVFKLHVDFSKVASLLKSRQATKTIAENMLNTGTSPA